MQLSREQVLHIAKLARLDLTKDEITRFTPQLSSIFSYVDMLSEVDTDGVEETAQVTGLSHVVRSDTPVMREDTLELISCSHLPIQDRHIAVKKVL